MDDNELVQGDVTSCGHPVAAAILDGLGYEDYSQAICHHCAHYNGDITDDKFEKLCKIEEKDNG